MTLCISIPVPFVFSSSFVGLSSIYFCEKNISPSSSFLTPFLSFAFFSPFFSFLSLPTFFRKEIESFSLLTFISVIFQTVFITVLLSSPFLLSSFSLWFFFCLIHFFHHTSLNDELSPCFLHPFLPSFLFFLSLYLSNIFLLSFILLFIGSIFYRSFSPIFASLRKKSKSFA